jgi:hypothetical protein
MSGLLKRAAARERSLPAQAVPKGTVTEAGEVCSQVGTQSVTITESGTAMVCGTVELGSFGGYLRVGRLSFLRG